MIKKCIFPVAGLGTRFLPVTKAIPKEMLPIGSTPLIEIGVIEAMKSQINSMVLVINNSKLSIKDYFQDDIDYIKKNNTSEIDFPVDQHRKVISKCDFDFAYQNDMKGLGHAILMAKNYIDDDAFSVILPDDLCFTDDATVLKQLINIYSLNQGKCIVALEEVGLEEVSKYGIVETVPTNIENLFSISTMVEKPSKDLAPSRLAIIGRYILTDEIFDILENLDPGQGGEIQITDALRILAEQGKVLGYKFKGNRIDCGNMLGYIDANNHYKQNYIKLKR